MPEVSRNKNIGEIGANMNAATFRKFLDGMAWAQVPVEDFGDLGYLRKDAYEAAQAELLALAELWQGSFKDATFEAGKVTHCCRVCGLSLCQSEYKWNPDDIDLILAACCASQTEHDSILESLCTENDTAAVTALCTCSSQSACTEARLPCALWEGNRKEG